MSHVLLTWEIGTGAGHLGKISVCAQALKKEGMQISLALPEPCTEHPFLRDFESIVAAPPLAHQEGGGLSLTWADNLLRNGLGSQESFAEALQAWEEIFDGIRPDCVVCENAPVAMAVARRRELPRIAMGSDFTLPGDPACVLSLHPWQNIPQALLEKRSKRFADTVNPVLEAAGHPPVDGVACLFDDAPGFLLQRSDQVARPLGPQEQAIGPLPLPRGEAAPSWPQGQGPKVFLYLDSRFAPMEELSKALGDRDCPSILVPNRGAPLLAKERFEGEGRICSLDLMDLGEVLEDCDLVISHGGASLTSHAANRAASLLLFPTQLEQTRRAWHMRKAGLASAHLPLEGPPKVQALLDDALARAKVSARPLVEEERALEILIATVKEFCS